MLGEIFSRTRLRFKSLGAIVGAALSVCSCLPPPSIPANVIIPDAHSSGDVVAFSARSDEVASAGADGYIRLWHLPEGRALARWKAHAGPVYGLAFLAHDRDILSAGYDGSIARWTTRGILEQRRNTPSHVTDMAADESGGVAITGHSDGTIRLWRLEDLSLIEELPLHDGAVRAVACDPRNRRFASSGSDGRVYVWRLGETPRELPRAPGDAHGLAFSPDGGRLAGGGWFRLFEWRLTGTPALRVLPTEHHGLIRSLQYTADGRTLATISRQTDSSVYFLDAATGRVVQRFQPHELCGASIRLSPDGRYLATTGDDASVRFWDLEHPLPERRNYAHDAADETGK